MACSVLIDKSEGKLKINSDSYDLNRISDVQVKVLTWKDKLINMFLFGLITSSILFYFIPTEAQGKGMTLFLPAVAFLAGMVMAMVTSAKYVFRLEFKHVDETGVQSGLTHQCLYFEQPHTFEQILFIQTAEPALVGHA